MVIITEDQYSMSFRAKSCIKIIEQTLFYFLLLLHNSSLAGSDHCHNVTPQDISGKERCFTKPARSGNLVFYSLESVTRYLKSMIVACVESLTSCLEHKTG